MAKSTHGLDDLISEKTTAIEKPISAKGQLFVDEYMVDMNASRAAKAAGYANRLFPKEHAVTLEVERRRKSDTRKLKITENRNLTEYARIAYFDPRMLFNEDGELKQIHELSDNEAACISSFDYEEQGADGDFKRSFKYKFIPKLPALESLSKFLGLFPDHKIEHTGKDGGPIEIEGMSDNDKARRIMFVLQSAIQAKKETSDIDSEEQGKFTIETQET